jgi:hypothetical protein
MMKLLCIIIANIFFISCKSQNIDTSDQHIFNDQSDSLKRIILERLNKDINEYKEYTGELSIEWNDIVIQDIIDTSNKEQGYDKHIKFIRNHVYHLAPSLMEFSFSYIIHIRNDGRLKIFEAINCKDRGDSLEDVLKYINDNKGEFNNLQLLLERVKNYRKYGSYIQTDEFSTMRCDCSPCE